MSPSHIVILIVLIILLIISSFFSASEMAYTSVNRIRLKSLEAAGDKRAKKINKQLGEYDKLLTTLLIGNNLVNILMTSLATIFFVDILKNNDLGVTVSTVVVTAAVLIFGEITPKMMAKEYPEAFLRVFSPLINLMVIIFYPFNFIFSLWKKLIHKVFKLKKVPGITEEELLTYVETAKTEGGIDEHESKLIRSAIEFYDMDVGDIMTPRVNVVAIAIDEDFEKIMQVFLENAYTRLPVFEGTIDTVVGILHERDYFAAIQSGSLTSINDLLKKPVCLSRNMRISGALRTLQKAKTHLAIVVDEFGGTAGIVTMEDIIEELVGEIYDEHDEIEELVKKVSDDTYLVSGSSNLLDVFKELQIITKDEFESASVGGWVTEQMHKIPLEDEKFVYNNLDIYVTKATDKRVLEIKIKINPPPEEE